MNLLFIYHCPSTIQYRLYLERVLLLKCLARVISKTGMILVLSGALCSKVMNVKDVLAGRLVTKTYTMNLRILTSLVIIHSRLLSLKWILAATSLWQPYRILLGHLVPRASTTLTSLSSLS
ncbi:uncharacterized protein L203_100357 [Cryptococcus depauperatus CBS 7841]|uniref:Uncharacterized protein n=1 Tax=Cryptococcus depauperatus CBS 7841 TaxID=1295531 RepID=A0AAJ8JMW9_9TREE